MLAPALGELPSAPSSGVCADTPPRLVTPPPSHALDGLGVPACPAPRAQVGPADEKAARAPSVVALAPGSPVRPASTSTVAAAVGVRVDAASAAGRSASSDSIVSGAMVSASQVDEGEAVRREEERRAREEERKGDGSALRRWLRDHFPFLF